MNQVILKQLAHMFLDVQGKDNEDLITMVEQHGYARDMAERYVALLPIAFGRVVMQAVGHVTFSETYKISAESDEYDLREEDIYVQALQLAIANYESGELGRERFTAIASRSAE